MYALLSTGDPLLALNRMFKKVDMLEGMATEHWLNYSMPLVISHPNSYPMMRRPTAEILRTCVAESCFSNSLIITVRLMDCCMFVVMCVLPSVYVQHVNINQLLMINNYYY